MTKKDFIALADAIRRHNQTELHGNTVTQSVLDGNCRPFGRWHIEALADFCQSSNAAFNRERWLGYIADENGKSGGKR